MAQKMLDSQFESLRYGIFRRMVMYNLHFQGRKTQDHSQRVQRVTCMLRSSRSSMLLYKKRVQVNFII